MKQRIDNKKDGLDILLEESCKYIKEKDYKKALEILTDAIEKHPENLGLSYAYLERSCVYEQLENYDLALSDINEAIIIEPDAVNYLLFTSISIFKKMNKIEMAIIDYTIIINSCVELFDLQKGEDKLSELKEHLASLYMDRSCLYREKKYTNLAKEDNDKAINILKYCKTINDIKQTMKYGFPPD